MKGKKQAGLKAAWQGGAAGGCGSALGGPKRPASRGAAGFPKGF